MISTRDRDTDLDDEPGTTPWDDRPVVGSFRGLPWWAAVLIALVLAGIGAMVDLKSQQQQLGWVFKGLYFLGCAVGVALVRRRSLFAPMVQPPLILAITVPVIALATSNSPSGGLSQKALAIGTPLVNGFPAMAVTTGVTVVIGVLRIFLQRDPNQPTKEERSAALASARRSDAKAKAARTADRRGEPAKRPKPAEGRRPAADAAPERRGTAGRDSRDGRDAGAARAGGTGRPASAAGRPSGGAAGRPAQGGGRPTPPARAPRQEPPRGGRQSPPPRRPRPRDDEY
ncbi:hypothetical protein F0L68_10360 [Solihabitans fulvus]|uniref:DUF6542 domain-containing protein n=1 Tax=Solihabitans fulvus TaxID=1892852 RepID=A0A5B2XH95_9PSEU|nr:DUF6542 domain-containing protein [Solihabitans fulvus]KAA2263218.1 hypothetical protein F0L68_10360 [Solihabitans fulvus]